MKSNSAIASEFFSRNSFAIKKLKEEYNVNFVKYPKDLLKKNLMKDQKRSFIIMQIKIN